MTPNGETEGQAKTTAPGPTPIDDNLKLTEKERADGQALIGRYNSLLLRVGQLEEAKQEILEAASNARIQRDNFGKKIERRHGLDPARTWNIDPFAGTIRDMGPNAQQPVIVRPTPQDAVEEPKEEE